MEIQHDTCKNCGERVERRTGGIFGTSPWIHENTRATACASMVATPVHEHEEMPTSL